MKRTFLIIASVMLSIGVFAQKLEIQNASNYSRNNDLERAIESAEKATTHSETSEDTKAWYLKGTILLKFDDMYSMVKVAKPGMTEKELEQAFAIFNPEVPNAPLKPNHKKKIKQEDKTKHLRAKYIYDVTAMFDENGKLYEITEPTNGKYLEKYNNDILKYATEAFQKAIQFNTDEEYVTNSKINLNVISQRYYNMGVNAYSSKDFLAASEYFDQAFTMSKDILNVYDTVSYELINNSIKMYMQESINKNDTTAYLKGSTMGRAKFPDDVFYVISEANIWLARNNPEKVIECLEEATKVVSDNPEIYYAVGVNYAALKNVDKAIEAYDRAILLNPDYYEANYNLGAIYVNKGNDVRTEANNLPLDQTEKYEQLNAQADSLFAKAAPYLEKAYALDKSETSVLTTLREIYIRMKRTDDVKRINDIIKGLNKEEDK